VRFSQSWIVASKDFAVFAKKKNIIYSMLIVPLLFSILLPVVTALVIVPKRPVAEITVLLPAFSFLFLALAGITPTTIASYSIVGEKLEKSLEPLLATPTTDSEILFGKGISAFLPAIAGILGGAAIFMTLMDLVTRSKLGYYFFPNLNVDILFFLMVPLVVMMSVEWNVIVSSRVSDVRVAQQLGYLLMVPFLGIYVAGELTALNVINFINLGVINDLLYLSAGLAVAVVTLLIIARATFRREEILTKWR
jgi:ABC-type Na+ efflux pump permease subunit